MSRAKCPKCGSEDVKNNVPHSIKCIMCYDFICNSCHHEWDDKHQTRLDKVLSVFEECGPSHKHLFMCHTTEILLYYDKRFKKFAIGESKYIFSLDCVYLILQELGVIE